MSKVTGPLFLKTNRIGQIPNNHRSDLPEWANDDYVTARNEFFCDTDKYRTSPTADNRCKLVETRRKFKQVAQNVEKIMIVTKRKIADS